MGVRGLKTHVNTLTVGEGEVWVQEVLSDTKVIIDGHGFCYHTYTSSEIEFKYGGEYDKVKNKTIEFFTKLRKNKVKPYVVFDGIMAKEDKKFDTRKKRKEERIKTVERWCNVKLQAQDMVLPLLVQLTVVQVLRQMQVPYAIADFEADCEIASLANELDAPVMAEDTDFCIFDINRGYIPFSKTTFSDETITVTKFSRNKFTKHLGIDPSMLPLFASLMGNDYIAYDTLRPIVDRICESVRLSEHNPKVRAIAKFLSNFESRLEDAISHVTDLCSNEDKLAFKKIFTSSIDEYQIKRSNLINYFDFGNLSSNIRTDNGHLLPKWIINLYRQGLIASEGLSHLCNRKVFLPTQCEDILLPSAQICARDLRWYYYALALNWAVETSEIDERPQAPNDDVIVTELYREGSTLVHREVNLRRRIREMKLRIYDMSIMSNQEKKDYLLKMLHSDLSFISNLPVKHQLVATAMRYWVIHANVKPTHLAALLVHFVGENRSQSTDSKFFEGTIEAVHGFSQWQNVLYWVQRLNALFSFPFEHLQVTKLYNGIHVCMLYEQLQGEGIEFAKSIVTNVNVYRHLYALITKKLPREISIGINKHLNDFKK